MLSELILALLGEMLMESPPLIIHLETSLLLTGFSGFCESVGLCNSLPSPAHLPPSSLFMVARGRENS